jgi:hypothetical protein
MSNSNFKLNKPNSDSFTRYPNWILDKLLASDLPLSARLIIDIVIRHTIGYQQREVLIPNKILRKVVPVNHSDLPQIIQYLIQNRILLGGPEETRCDGRVLSYRLSVNQNGAEWDIGILPENKTALKELVRLNQRLVLDKAVSELKQEPVFKPESEENEYPF